jgi:hypothetical protein
MKFLEKNKELSNEMKEKKELNSDCLNSSNVHAI